MVRRGAAWVRRACIRLAAFILGGLFAASREIRPPRISSSMQSRRSRVLGCTNFRLNDMPWVVDVARKEDKHKARWHAIRVGTQTKMDRGHVRNLTTASCYWPCKTIDQAVVEL